MKAVSLNSDAENSVLTIEMDFTKTYTSSKGAIQEVYILGNAIINVLDSQLDQLKQIKLEKFFRSRSIIPRSESFLANNHLITFYMDEK